MQGISTFPLYSTYNLNLIKKTLILQRRRKQKTVFIRFPLFTPTREKVLLSPSCTKNGMLTAQKALFHPIFHVLPFCLRKMRKAPDCQSFSVKASERRGFRRFHKHLIFTATTVKAKFPFAFTCFRSNVRNSGKKRGCEGKKTKQMIGIQTIERRAFRFAFTCLRQEQIEIQRIAAFCEGSEGKNK